MQEIIELVHKVLLSFFLILRIDEYFVDEFADLIYELLSQFHSSGDSRVFLLRRCGCDLLRLLLRKENRENITGISEDIPDKYLRRVEKNNVRKKIGEEMSHVAHKTEERRGSRFADTKQRTHEKEENKDESQCHICKGVDRIAHGEQCDRSEEEEHNVRQIRSDVVRELEGDHEKDCTDPHVGLVTNEAPHHCDDEWIEVEKRRSKK